MYTKLSKRELGLLERYFVNAKGKGFSLPGRVPKSIKKAVDLGFVEVSDCSFFKSRRTKRHFAFTDVAKCAIVRCIADRYSLDTSDAHHLVLTGNMHLASRSTYVSLLSRSNSNSDTVDSASPSLL